MSVYTYPDKYFFSSTRLWIFSAYTDNLLMLSGQQTCQSFSCHLLEDIQTLEWVQRRCTTLILNDYLSNYKDSHISFKLLPLSLWLELLDITFLLNCLKYPKEHFDIFQYVQFVSSTTTSSSHSKLKCLLPQSFNTDLNFIYFNRVVKLWNALSDMDL